MIPPDIGKWIATLIVPFASLAAVTAVSHSAELSPASEAKSQPPASRTAPPPITLSNAQIEALLRDIGIRFDSRIQTASRPVRKPSPPPQPTARRHWRQYSDSATADRGEATRLMVGELQQRGVAVDTGSESGPPK
jgi:hypothetical protein